MLALLAASFPAPIARAADQATGIERVRVGRHQHYVRVVLDAGGAIRFDPTLSADHRRITVPLEAVPWHTEPSRSLTETDLLAAYRYESAAPDGPALILEATRPVVLRATLALPPDQITPHHRYVLDIAPGIPAAPDPEAAGADPPVTDDPGRAAAAAGPAPDTAPALGTVRVTGVRIGRHPEKARLVLDAAGETRFRPQLDAAGRSVRIPFAAVDWQAAAAEPITAIPFLTSYRFEPRPPGGTFRVEADRPLQILAAMVLAPDVGTAHFRYVLDLAPLPVPADRPPARVGPASRPSAVPPGSDRERAANTPATADAHVPADTDAAEAWTPPDPDTAFRSVESYMRRLTTLQARFVQVVDDAHRITGTFYLSRPGRMRLVYDPPIQDFFVADGWFLFYWDDELGQQSSTPIGSSLADFILREDFSLSEDVTVTRLRLAPDRIDLTVVRRDDPAAGSLTLGFGTAPVRLLEWTARDKSGQRTRVVLSQLQTGLDLDEDLFYFVRPRPREPRDN